MGKLPPHWDNMTSIVRWTVQRVFYKPKGNLINWYCLEWKIKGAPSRSASSTSICHLLLFAPCVENIVAPLRQSINSSRHSNGYQPVTVTTFIFRHSTKKRCDSSFLRARIIWAAHSVWAGPITFSAATARLLAFQSPLLSALLRMTSNEWEPSWKPPIQCNVSRLWAVLRDRPTFSNPSHILIKPHRYWVNSSVFFESYYQSRLKASSSPISTSPCRLVYFSRASGSLYSGTMSTSIEVVQFTNKSAITGGILHLMVPMPLQSFLFHGVLSGKY